MFTYSLNRPRLRPDGHCFCQTVHQVSLKIDEEQISVLLTIYDYIIQMKG
jgi:hypothetical protein